mgnify:CR=1 FL=1
MFFPVFFAACATSSPSPPTVAPAPVAAPVTPEASEPQDPTARLHAAERALIEDPVRLRFVVQSQGAVDAQFVGALVMDGDRVQIEASGQFAGTPVEVSFRADGERMRGEGGAQAFDLPQADGLREVLGVSVVRMGLLHTLAMLVVGQPPEVPSGDVREWLVTTPLSDAPTVAVMKPHHDDLPADPVTFGTTVAGDDSITATVWIDEGMLLERQQETRFDEGTMTVLEAFEPL